MTDADLREWDSASAEAIFRVSAHRSAHGCVYLPELAEELSAGDGAADGGHPPRISLGHAEGIIVERLSLESAGPGAETSWDYLVHAWVRCRQEELAARRRWHGAALERALGLLAGARALITSYVGLVLQMPDMFPRSTKHNMHLSPRALVPSLLRLGASTGTLAEEGESDGTQSWAAVPAADAPQFIGDLVLRFASDESAFADTVGAALYDMVQEVRTGLAGAGPSSATNGGAPQGGAPGVSDGDVQAVVAQLLGIADPRTSNAAAPRGEGMTIASLDWRPVLAAVGAATELRAVAAALPFLPTFSPANVTAPTLETDTLLGPLLRLSCFYDAYPSIAQQYFTDLKTRSPTEVENSMHSLRMALEVVQGANFRIWNAMVRAGAAPREQVIAFWGRICALNAKRGAMQVRAREVASDAFMVNVYDLVLRFAEPFVEPTYSKMDRIDPTYLRRQQRWDTRTLTRVHSTEADAVAWMDGTAREEGAARVDEAPNFITEVFYIAARLSSVALGKAMRRVDEREKEMDRLQKRVDELEGDRTSWQTLPHASSVEHIVKRAQAQGDRLHSEIVAAQTQLLEPSFVRRVVGFTSFAMMWLVRLADPQQAHPQRMVTLPLPAEVPTTFAMLPEHMFEDVCDTVLFYARRNPEVLDQDAQTSIVVFCTTFLSSGWFIRNPFLKAKLAEMLSYNLMPFGGRRMGLLSDTVNGHPLAIQHLVPALMTFWIDAESTGSHTQFYDKFNIRYHLTQVFKAVWTNPEHKRQLHEHSENCDADFVVFINRLMNDVTFLLDDALDKLVELHAKQVEMDDDRSWHEGRSAEERQEREGLMRSIQGQIRSDLGLGHEFLRLLINFTAETSGSFMTPEIVDRLAAMLDYNLDVLVGPRCQELKVKDPKRVGFDPRSLLSEILSVFLNLAGHPEFAAAIARDGRSYRRETFSKAASIAQRHMLKSPAEIEVLAHLVDAIERVRQEDADEEEELGDVPDEFLDPLLATLMKDPVCLPSSRAVLDRSTIKAHLLSDGTDPFNRMPLKLDDVKPDDALRVRIHAWLQERRHARSV
ncbi:RING-type E3 ubiquitin transferase [Malassezia sp. CBS 17886]|nr:RING-type E3 ubiquitin transferase [Malassezia sp. CBS 17886]